MSRFKLLAILAICVVALTIPALASAAAPHATSPVTINLGTLNNSGESGTAVLTDLGNGQTKVDVTITGEPSGASNPMHIHTGQCGPTLGGVAFPLTPVVNGTSTTTVATSLASIMDGNHAINGHKSAAEIGTYVFCGNIPNAAASSTTAAPTSAPAATPTTSTPSTVPTTGGNPFASLSLVVLAGLVLLGGGLFVRRLAR